MWPPYLLQTPDSYGSMIELCWGGKKEVDVGDGQVGGRVASGTYHALRQHERMCNRAWALLFTFRVHQSLMPYYRGSTPHHAKHTRTYAPHSPAVVFFAPVPSYASRFVVIEPWLLVNLERPLLIWRPRDRCANSCRMVTQSS